MELFGPTGKQIASLQFQDQFHKVVSPKCCICFRDISNSILSALEHFVEHVNTELVTESYEKTTTTTLNYLPFPLFFLSECFIV